MYLYGFRVLFSLTFLPLVGMSQQRTLGYWVGEWPWDL